MNGTNGNCKIAAPFCLSRYFRLFRNLLPCAWLEVELQPELNNAGIGSGQNLTEAARITRNIRRAEIGAVERIEQFGAELKVIALGQVKVLRQREVEVYRSRAAHNPDACGTERLRRGGEGGLEGVGVEPALQCALRFGQHGIAHQIGTRSPLSTDVENTPTAQRGRQTKTAL